MFGNSNYAKLSELISLTELGEFKNSLGYEYPGVLHEADLMPGTRMVTGAV